MLKSIDLWVWTYLFLTYVIADVLNIRYLLAVQATQPFASANYSLLLYLIGAIGTREYVTNPVNMIPCAVGLWAGTYIITKYEQLKKRKKDERRKT